MTYPIPANFTQCMVELHDDAGVAWLDRLPALLAVCEQRWGLTVGPPFPLSYNYVAPAVRADGGAVVLKVGFPGDELLREIEALRLYDGHGIARLLEADRDQGAFLLERLAPGTPLAHLRDDERMTSIAAQVMKELWRPAPAEHGLTPLAEWVDGIERLRLEFAGGTGPFPRHLVEQAESLFAELLASMATPVVLHGDLHHENILQAERQPWLAIDPKGLVGEPAYEVGPLLYNQLPEPFDPSTTRRILSRRMDQLAEELSLDRRRIQAWAFAQSVLSAWWSYEDHGHGWEPTLALAEVMRDA